MLTLGDRRHLTNLLVLREMALHPEAPLRVVADALDVTVQAVSVHAQRLREDGLVAREDGDDGRRAGYRVTPKGLAALQEGFQDLKRHVDGTLRHMAVVRTTSAIAGAPILAGERVDLVMEQGILVARPSTKNGEGSTGTARVAADAGEEVLVQDLSGVVDLQPGRLVAVRVPSPDDGGSRAVHLPRLGALLRERGVHPDKVAVLGIPALALTRRLGQDVHLAFAPPAAAFHAAELGLNVLLYVSRDLSADALHRLDELNEDALAHVPVEVLDAPTKQGRSTT